MLIIGLFFLFLLIGVIFIIISKENSFLELFGIIFTVFSLGTIIISLIVIGMLYLHRDVSFTMKEEKRNSLVYQLNQIENGDIKVSNAVDHEFYKSINQFNQDIIYYKWAKDSLWFNWFTNPKLAILEKIELKHSTKKEVKNEEVTD